MISPWLEHCWPSPSVERSPSPIYSLKEGIQKWTWAWHYYYHNSPCGAVIAGSIFIQYPPNRHSIVRPLVRGKGKGKVTILSPHPGSELCSADFDKYLPWSLGLYSPYIHFDIHLNSPGSIQPLTRNLAPRLTNLRSRVPICSWVERSNAAWSALLKGTTSRRTGRVLNSGLDLEPNPESCTLPLDQLAAKYGYRYGVCIVFQVLFSFCCCHYSPASNILIKALAIKKGILNMWQIND